MCGLEKGQSFLHVSSVKPASTNIITIGRVGWIKEMLVPLMSCVHRYGCGHVHTHVKRHVERHVAEHVETHVFLE